MLPSELRHASQSQRHSQRERERERVQLREPQPILLEVAAILAVEAVAQYPISKAVRTPLRVRW